MDIKLKKTHRNLKVFIILFTVILPAVVLVALYPRMSKVADELIEAESYKEYSYYISEDFVKDAVALLSYEYAEIALDRGEITQEEYDTNASMTEERAKSIKMNNVYYQYYYTVDEAKSVLYGNISEEYIQHLADYALVAGTSFIPQKILDNTSMGACYIVEFGQYGAKHTNSLSTGTEIYCSFDVNDSSWVGTYLPKNIRAVFFAEAYSPYIEIYEHYYGYSVDQAYYEIGALVPMFLAIGLVALVALILPFIKRLNIGNERIFKLPAEIVIGIGGLTAYGFFIMYLVMCHTNMTYMTNYFDANGQMSVLGYTFSTRFVYICLLVINLIGWLVCFFAEYVVVTVIRQLISNPVRFVKERFIVINVSVKIYKWLKVQISKLYRKIVDIVKSLETNKLLVIILSVNFIVAVFSVACGFVIGVSVFIIYTVVAYVLVYKKYMKVCGQFKEIENTVEKMAEGNLKIEIKEDLGVFEPVGISLSRIKESFEEALIEEAKSRDMKTELITNVSHDLKTPLTAIITYIDLLKKEDISNEDRRQYINTLDIKSQRLKVLIEDLFEVSKANSGNVHLDRMDVDVVGLMKQVRLELEDRINDSNINFKWIFPEEKVILSLDGQKTYRIFANLINNIIKYSLKGSRAYVEIKDSEDKVVITFKNVSENEINCDVENLTERFVRGDASRNSEGSGLGLAIVKSFVELQDGKFTIDVDGDLFKANIMWNK